MATPTFNTSGHLTTISVADTIGSSWNISDIDTAIKVEGVAAHYDAIRDGGTLTYTFGAAADMSATDTHVRLWMQHTFPANLHTLANGSGKLDLMRVFFDSKTSGVGKYQIINLKVKKIN